MSKVMDWVSENILLLVATGTWCRMGIVFYGWEFLYVIGGVMGVTIIAYLSPRLRVSMLSWYKKKQWIYFVGLMVASGCVGALCFMVLPERFVVVFTTCVVGVVCVLKAISFDKEGIRKADLYREVLENNGGDESE